MRTVRLQKRTKIVCTMGPACADKEMVRGLVRAGMDVARLNFSHGTHDDHLQFIQWLRELAEEEGRHLAILQDLPGPKLRTGDLGPNTEEIELVAGAEVTLTSRQVEGTGQLLSVNYEKLPSEVGPGQSIFLADGRIRLEALESGADSVRTRVVAGGRLRARQGVNLPGARLSLPAVTEKDLEHLAFGLEHGVDWVALSFVRSREDILPAREAIDRAGTGAGLIAKIEKGEAAEQADAILEGVDGLMVARGDLGIEVPLEQVPFIQKRLIKKAVDAGKPVITATQMLESMMRSPRPTRAEVSDVANAIMDGSDAVMLSGETAVGQYPREAAEIMASVAREAEARVPYRSDPLAWDGEQQGAVEELIGYASAGAAHELGIGLIVTATASGSTAQRIARHRPEAQILALTPRPVTARRLCLSWGVRTEIVPVFQNSDEIFALAGEWASKLGCTERDRIVVTAGVPVGREGTTNLLHVLDVGATGLWRERADS